jgi:hypothetical protein
LLCWRGLGDAFLLPESGDAAEVGFRLRQSRLRLGKYSLCRMNAGGRFLA